MFQYSHDKKALFITESISDSGARGCDKVSMIIRTLALVSLLIWSPAFKQ